MAIRKEHHDLHGNGSRLHEVYDMPRRSGAPWWEAVTEVPCPVLGCEQTVAWYEAGYVPGYRVCMTRAAGEPDAYDRATLRHRFVVGASDGSTLIRHDCCEQHG